MRGTMPAAALSLLWLGMLIGVSFVATPAKFNAPSLTLPVALDVGRHTFALFSKIEIAFALALFVAVLATGRAVLIGAALAVGIVLAIQVAWLLPVLDARVSVILGGAMPPPSSLHWIYIVLDAGRVLLLGVIACLAIIRPR